MDAQSLFGVDGLVAVITGGGSGLGLLMALTLAANNAKRVYILGRRLDVLQAACDSCPQGTLVPIVCDVTSKASLTAAAATVAAEVGYVNLVVANAGSSGPPTFGAPTKAAGGTVKELKEFLWKHSEEAYASQFEIHVTGTLWTALAFLELLDEGNRSGYGNRVGPQESRENGVVPTKQKTMVKEGPMVDGFIITPPKRPEESLFTAATSSTTSQILAISSIAGLNKMHQAGFGYGASKAAQIHLSRMLAVHMEPFGIRSNVLAPGFFLTEMTMPIAKRHPAGKLPRSTTPMERLGTDEEIGGTVLWLAGRAGAYCNGNVVMLDGGRLLVNPGVA